MSVDLLLNILATFMIVGVLVVTVRWLRGGETPTFTTRSRGWALTSAGLIATIAITYVITAHWLVAVAFALWSALQFAVVLAPDLPTGYAPGQGDRRPG